MTYVGYIGEFDGKHLVYSMVDNEWSVTEFESEGLCKQKMKEMKATAMIILFEQFLIIDKDLQDTGKNVVSYKELRKRLQDYLNWSLDNQHVHTDKVISSGFKMRKVMNQMIKMISPEHPDRKHLIFLMFNVTKLAQEPYNV